MEESSKCPKYSILLPVHNGGEYLRSCLRTILDQAYDDVEIIVSDDHSIDDTPAFLRKIHDSRVRVIGPQNRLSMAEHWDWVLGQARGQWMLFVGQDDGLQPYFFELADRLTKLADRKGIRAIMSERAYFFWPGCEDYYGDKAVDYSAHSNVSIMHSWFEAFSALAGFQEYFVLPEMYTTSLFSKELIEEAKTLQGGRLFVTHPQDANLAAIACSLERRYLKSGIPLGWVGSSPKSAGLAVTSGSSGTLGAIKSEYLDKTRESQLKCNARIGDFAIGSCALYLWGAFLESSRLLRPHINRTLTSRTMTKLVFSAALKEVEIGLTAGREYRLKLLDDALAKNALDRSAVNAFRSRYSRLLLSLAGFAASPFGKLLQRLLSLLEKGHVLRPHDRVSAQIARSDNPDMTLEDAQEVVRKLIAAMKVA